MFSGRRSRTLGVLYLGLLAASHLVWLLTSQVPALASGESVLQVPEVVQGESTGRQVRVVYRDSGPRDAPVLLLLHGSPGGLQNFRKLETLLRDRYRVLAPDLPGFGQSVQPLADYSIETHAREMLSLLAQLGVERAHLLGFSMGGGVALHMADLEPERVASITMLSAIGVQELELFGSFAMNHAVHGLQLALFQAARWLLPHFGKLDGALGYPRNFFDTDQRPLRGILSAHAGPMLIVHGEQDFLVPAAAAREHHRLVPQSELLMLAERSHFLLWFWTEELAQVLGQFVDRVERGEAVARRDAQPARMSAARVPFDPASVPPFTGGALLIAVLLLAAATLVSEDLTCIGAGLLVSQARMGFGWAVLGCFSGILIGDLALYFLGRWFGRPALRRAPLRWVVSEAKVEEARAWFERRGVAVIFLSRFTPGLRLPTYVAAGVVGTHLATFAFWFALAGLLWTPALVGLAAWAGVQAEASLDLFREYALPGVVGLILALLLVQRLAIPLCTWRGRRLLLGRLKRKLQWEFWPPWLFYSPLVLWVAWLAVRHRGLSQVTAVNPGIHTGGFIGESKSEILLALGQGHPLVARWTLVRAADSPTQRRAVAEEFLAASGLAPPLVLKPDVGQRGSGVLVLHDLPAVWTALDDLEVDCMLQEFVDGPEFGLFYARRPGEPRGFLFSVTEKRLPELEGDGRSTVERLILADSRAVAAADVYLAANAGRLAQVPDAGAKLRLVEIGTHCRGAVFLDGEAVRTEALERTIDELSQGFEGFWFGRYDVRCESSEALARGEGLRVIELNGLTSEATHIYDPRHSLLYAYRVLFRQWSLAFEIARANLAAGARATPLWTLLREMRTYRRLQRAHRNG